MHFSVRLETSHVVDTSKQLWAGVLPHDKSNNMVFNWSYKNTENVRLQDVLGESLLDICKVTPGGVLVFFSSYGILNKVVARWKTTNFMAALVEQKCVLVEPNGPIDNVIAAFYRANGDESKKRPSSRSKGGGGGGRNEQPVQVLKSQTGGLLLAVCRGKVSEGIDFTDQHCRAVVIVGLPFPNTKDLQLRLKKEDHDSKSRVDSNFLNGSAWYSLQAFRALNQAVGRCIRHRNDYGAVILLDERFTEQRTTHSVSKWMRPSIAIFPKFDDALASLREFFARNAAVAADSAGAGVVPVPVASIAAADASPGKRWCCSKCARPLSLSAKPRLFSCNKSHMLQLGGSAALSQSIECLVFDPNSLNSTVVFRDAGDPFYVAADGLAYVNLKCACQSSVGVIVEAANAENVNLIGEHWLLGTAVLL